NRLTAVFVVLSRVASLIKRLNICNFQGSIEPFSLALFFHKSLDTTCVSEATLSYKQGLQSILFLKKHILSSFFLATN
ncbi:MAG: hypothetical protein UH963_08630, partial [Agathobacter sp.]|nr:hypothetical protein [Agathobacter sp.]